MINGKFTIFENYVQQAGEKKKVKFTCTEILRTFMLD